MKDIEALEANVNDYKVALNNIENMLKERNWKSHALERSHQPRARHCRVMSAGKIYCVKQPEKSSVTQLLTYQRVKGPQKKGQFSPLKNSFSVWQWRGFRVFVMVQEGGVWDEIMWRNGCVTVGWTGCIRRWACAVMQDGGAIVQMAVHSNSVNWWYHTPSNQSERFSRELIAWAETGK